MNRFAFALAMCVWPFTSAHTIVAPAPQARMQPCSSDRGPVFVGADCGTIRVHENRQTKEGRTIDIAFARWRAHGRAATGAVMLLAGGPGGSGDSMARDVEGWAQPLRSTLDIIVVDQRGTGLSNSLHCARAIEADPASAFGHIFDTAWLRECRSVLGTKADLRQYTTENAADDLDEVRAALGYQQVSLYGGSYGTRLAQAYMRRYPQRTRAVVLDGVMPLDTRIPLTYAATAQAALDRVLEVCAATPACHMAHPALAASFGRVLDRFKAGPVSTSVTPPGRAAVPVTMSRGDFGYAVRGILYGARGVQELPDLIERAASTGDLHEFAQRYWERQLAFSRTFAMALHLSVLCSEDVAFIRTAEIAGVSTHTFLDRYVVDEYRRACADWPAAQIRADFTRQVTSSAPTLLVSGYFDPVTPPAFADAIARTLPVSRHVVSMHTAHGSVGACPREAALFVLRTGTLTGMPAVCQ